MTRLGLGFLALTLLLVAAIGCERNDTTGPDPAAITAADKSYPTEKHLADLVILSRATLYYTYTAPVSLTGGGTVYAHPDSWTSPLECSVVVPGGAFAPEDQNALDPDGDGLVMIQISVPIPPSPLPESWVPVYKLAPEGIEFDEDITVTLVYPEVMAPTKDLQVYRIVRKPSGGWTFSDYHCDSSTDNLWSITFTTRHFSRWPLELGKEGIR